MTRARQTTRARTTSRARRARTARGRRLALGAALALGAMSAGAPAAAPPLELKGACYCRAAAELRCVADLTEPDCRRRCADELCDDWFWLERRPCWNWGYGG